MGGGDERRHNNFTAAKFELKMFLQCKFLGQVATLFTVCPIPVNIIKQQMLAVLVLRNR